MKLQQRILATCLSALLAFQGFGFALPAYAATDGQDAAVIEQEMTDASDDAMNEESQNDAALSGAASDSSTAGDAVSASATSEVSSEDNESSTSENAIALADEAALASASINTLDELRSALSSGSAVTESSSVSGTADSININDEKDLKVISYADASLYQNATIQRGNVTGDTTTNLCADSGEAYSFQGFGDSDHPFAGKIVDSNNKPLELTTDRTVYNALALNSGNATISIIWKGSTSYSKPMIAATIAGASDSSGSITLAASIKIADPATTSSSETISENSAALTAPLIGSASGNLAISAAYAFTGTRKALNISATDNIALLANTVSDGTFAIKDVTGLENANDGGVIKTSSGNAGLFVGEAKAGASIAFSSGSNFSLSKGITVESESGCAGGLVGLAGENAPDSSAATGSTIALTKALDLSNLTVKGTTASGGLIGKAVNLSLTQDSGSADSLATFTCPANVGSTSSLASGGFIGWANFSNAKTFTGNNEINTGTNGVTLAQKNDDADGGAGAVFGHLRLTNGDVKFVGNGTFASKLSGSDNAEYGGIAGSVRSTYSGNGGTSARSLTVEANSDGSGPVINITTEATPRFAGGIVGWVGKTDYAATVAIEGVTVACNSPKASQGFGGIVGALDQKSVLDAGSFAVSSSGDSLSSNGAGVVGASWNSTLYLHGTSDLSGFSLSSASSVGQIAVFNTGSPSLAFAAGSGCDSGWTYKRCPAVEADDIAGYGQVVRLTDSSSGSTSTGGLSSGFISLDSTSHQPVFSLASDTDGKLAASSGTYTLSSADDFACYAITVQTRGNFSGVSDIGADNWSSLMSKTINLGGDIDLSGTGITGLTQDEDAGNTSEAYFTGTLNGNDRVIKLAVGEPYGKRGDSAIATDDSTEGNGKVYFHNRLGLFSNDGGSTVNELTIDGSIRAKSDEAMAIGAYAAEKCSSFNSVLTKLSVSTSLTLDQNSNKKMFAGNVYGTIENSGWVTFGTGCAVASSLKSSGKPNGSTRIGGVIGSIDDESTTTITVNALAVSGSMTVTGGEIDNLGAGGFIAGIEKGSTKSIAISGLNLSVLQINLSGAKKTTGGFLGYSWANTNVTFKGSSEAYALKTSNASLSVTGAGKQFSLGGLVYRASGVWDVGQYAIDYSGATLSGSSVQPGSNLGLLVCVGGDDGNLGGSLYLKNTADWASSYKVDGLGLSGIESFSNIDEWVYNTCANDKSIMDCGSNGVVSLHTNNDTLDMYGNSTSCNSYVNRTTLGEAHPTNGNSRYYYNLDRAATASATSNGYVDTPSELLLWSVSRYAASNIAENFKLGDAASSNIIGGASDASTVNLNMTGYSYYPVDVAGENVTVQNANITFCNSAIEAEESGNKVTSSATQHMNMHAGLLRNFSCGSSAVTYKVSNVTLAGSVGPDVSVSDSAAAGALLSGTMTGSSTNSAIAKLDITGLTLNGIVVRGVDAKTTLAPLLACNLGTYTALDVAGISVASGSYVDGTGVKTAATSLFGNLGGETAEQVTASFTNVAVPSLKTENGGDAIFTHASLLETYSYAQNGASSATYTFTKANDDAKKVTYGKEIDSNGNSAEYAGKQLWYYDESLNGNDDGLVSDGTRTASADSPQFSVYLPYVAKGKSGDTYHEIKVNQRVANLVTGCGTYGDPYSITTASELYAIANFINDGNAIDGWLITVTKDQETLCTRRSDKSTDNEVTYQYSAADSEWKPGTYSADTGTWTASGGDPLSKDTMQRYIQSCYLSIESTQLEVDAKTFTGLGNHDYPFRGVIVGNLVSSSASDDATTTAASYATIVLKNSEDSHTKGLIPYSYGSVVRNLNIKYTGTANTIEYAAKNSEDGVPNAFFGGVIGCIMGGDNIIDGVTVSAGDEFTVSAASGDKSHLVAIGGYIGAIAGGGVIFRNMSSDSSWRKSGANLYDNPYVGRVIDGFAFSEGCEVDNGDDNYKINELNTSLANCVTTTNIQNKYREGSTSTAATVSVSNAQGLLVLSAIISSGAASGAVHTTWLSDTEGVFVGSRAYRGFAEETIPSSGYRFGNTEYGKVRNSDYSTVGNAGTDDTNFTKSVADDLKAPGMNYPKAEGPLNHLEEDSSKQYMNSPYLVAKYANQETGYVCASKLSGINLQFAEGEKYDMTGYGSGFTGLSGRYYSNACYSGNKSNDRDRIIPWIACIDGNNATLTLSSTVKEYQDDDYSVAGVGGLFSSITYTSNYVSSSISGNSASVKDITFNNCNVSLSYLDSSNNPVSDYAKSNTGVGILAGVTANANSQSSYGTYKNITITADSEKTTKVNGAENAGGLYGSAGYAQRSTSSDVNEIVKFDYQSDQCAPVKLYDCSYSNLSVEGTYNAGGFVGKIYNGECGVWVSESKTVASDSVINGGNGKDNESNSVGGIFGLVGCTVGVNTSQGDSASQVATMSNVSVTSENSASRSGGNTRGCGSMVGHAENTVTVNRIKITSTKEVSGDSPTYLGTNDSNRNENTDTAAKNVGGIVGYSNHDVTVNDSEVEAIKIAVGEHGGGIVGSIDAGVNLSVKETTVSGIMLDGSRMGGIVGNVGKSGANVIVANSTVRNCAFSGKASLWGDGHPGGNGNFSGGIVGYALGTYKVSNVLLSENTFADTTKRQGLLVGCTAQNSGDFGGIYAAGINVKLAANQTNDSVPAVICYFNESNGDKAAINKKSYIAFADYTDSCVDDTKAGTSGLYGATGVSPYVTTSPKSGVSVKAYSDSEAQSLFGDGVAITTAATIQNEAGSNVDERYTYTNIGGIGSGGAYQNTNTYDPKTSASTFNANNTNKTVGTDFPVLLLSGNDTQTVTDYLNLVTNGGFSDAVRLNSDSTKHVTATVQTFALDADGGSFVASSTAPTVSVVNNGSSNMFFRATSQWDNEKGQFTLLTVTFSEAGQTYNVQVPIIVKRMLEIDFTATYSYGTNFNASHYLSLGENAHVLTNFNEPMTGYLTWTYNQAKGEATEYGWDTHLASGASMGTLGKSIVFDGSDGSGALPAGTQLTLVDTAHNDKAYHYTVATGGATSVALTDFVDSYGNKYEEQWLSELMGVTATEDGSGAWVVCGDDDTSKAGAKVTTDTGSTYYRAYDAQNDSGKTRYTLSVEKNNDKEISPSENFYLTINVPVPKNSDSSTAVNGYTGTSFTDTSINKNLNCTLRTGTGTDTDKHQNSASTYSIFSSYTQTLADNNSSTDISAVTQSEGTGYAFSLGATDTVSFNSSQAYTGADKLYYQFNASLVNYSKGSDDTATSTGATGFPTGTSATLNFFVMVGDDYYTPVIDASGTTTWSSVGTTKTVAATKSWTADGSDLSVVLSDDDDAAIDLSGLREIAKSNNSRFGIIVEASDLTMTEEACKQGIAASQKGSSYTKVHYRANLSTSASTLATSSMIANAAGNPGYYREDTGTSTIELAASKQEQLGINVSDLGLADGTIGAVGTYSLLKMNDAESLIKSAASVRYTLTLQQRTGTDGTYGSVNIADYLSVTSSALGVGTPSTSDGVSSITFTDAKGDSGFATRDGSTNCFKFPFQVKVKTDVEGAKHPYANYRIVLKAELLDSGGSVINTPTNALGTNTDSDYITFTLTKVNVEGIAHSSTSTS